MERSASVRSRTVQLRVDAGGVFAAIGPDGPAAVWSDPAGGPAFIGSASTEHDVVVADDAEAAAAILRDRLATPADTALLGWWTCLSYELGVAAAGLEPAGGAPRAARLRRPRRRRRPGTR